MTEDSEEHPSSDEHEVIASEKAAWHRIAIHGSKCHATELANFDCVFLVFFVAKCVPNTVK